ncbi:MAG: hypothetical protein QM840_10405 [Verrucomicrobiota bacterium]|nr:hypothetical protein [Verrucomicrobiota bacterium]
MLLPCFYAVYKGCTRDAHRESMGFKLVHPLSIPCTPLVHGLKAGYFHGIRVVDAGA